MFILRFLLGMVVTIISLISIYWIGKVMLYLISRFISYPDLYNDCFNEEYLSFGPKLFGICVGWILIILLGLICILFYEIGYHILN